MKAWRKVFYYYEKLLDRPKTFSWNQVKISQGLPYSKLFHFGPQGHSYKSMFFALPQPPMVLNINSFIFSKCFILVRAMVDSEPVPVPLGAIHPWMRHQSHYTFTPRTHSHLEAIQSNCHVLGGGSKPQEPARHLLRYTDSNQSSGFLTRDSRGINATHCATIPTPTHAQMLTAGKSLEQRSQFAKRALQSLQSYGQMNTYQSDGIIK